jgi:phage terminase large subunit-like protein
MERVLDGRFPPMNFYLEGVTEEERERVKNRGYETFQPLK